VYTEVEKGFISAVLFAATRGAEMAH